MEMNKSVTFIGVSHNIFLAALPTLGQRLPLLFWDIWSVKQGIYYFVKSESKLWNDSCCENCGFFLLPAAALLFPIWHGDSWAVVRWFIGSALDNLPASNNIKTSHTAKHQDISYEGEKYNMELNHNENIKQIKASSISDGESWNHCDQKSQGSKVTLCVLLTTMIWLPVSQK